MIASRSDLRNDELTSLLDQGLQMQALAFAEQADASVTGDQLYHSARRTHEAAKPEDALRWLDLAKQAFRMEGKPLVSLRTDLGRINVLDDLGRTNESIQVAETLSADLERFDPDRLSDGDRDLHAWLSAAVAENLGASLGLAGRHVQAVQAHERARDRYRDVGSPVDVARANANLGVSLIRMGDAATGLATLEAARTFFSAANDDGLIDRCLMYESRALAMLGQYGVALDRLALVLAPQADASSAAKDQGPDTLRSELTRAGVYAALNLTPEVVELCERLAPEFDRRAMTTDLADTKRVHARAALGLGDAQDALRLSRESVRLFELADLPIRAAEARITLARCLGGPDGSAEIDHALPVLKAAGELRGVAEAALMGADLTTTSVARTAYLDAAISAGALEADETRWQTLWHQSRDAAAQDRIEMLDGALATLAGLQRGLAQDHLRAPFMVNRRDPLESRLTAHLDAEEYGEAFALSVAHRFRALVEPGGTGNESLSTHQPTALYQAIGERLVCFIAHPSDRVGSPSIDFVDLGNVLPQVRALLVELEAKWRHLADPRVRVHIAALRSATEGVLGRLHQALFAEVETRMQAGPITIVPAGCLSAVPFSALYDGSSYLVDRRAVSISPGLPRRNAAERLGGGRTLVVGLPDQQAPLITTEVNQVADLTGGRLMLGTEALADDVRAAAAEAQTLHLATHSVFRSDNPWLSWIRLADRDVTAAEFATWDLQGKTVVLAACSSGRQSNVSEDEALGLPRAAFVAGAATVIVNQWTVDDIASVGLMSQLHAGLAHHSPADALRRAQLACRDLHPHPYFWAGTMVSINPFIDH